MSPDTAGYRIDTLVDLGPSDVRSLVDLIERVTQHDGMHPLSEHAWLHLKAGGDARGMHLLACTSEGTPVGYAHLDVTDEGASAELAVDPAHRRRGIGRLLVQTLIENSPAGRLRLWSHGEQAGAAELARDLGFHLSRVLWQMRRSLYAPLPQPVLPDGVVLRPFRVGLDEAEWLRINAAAFANLPDQGGWTAEDLRRRIEEPWFSPAGFLVAWLDDRMIGFHWTKVHGHASSTDHAHGDGHHQHQPIGEVYVVAVDPPFAGMGLGRALTLAGLHHLRSLDLPQAMLYVDSSNSAAIALYTSLGFARWDTDVLFTRDG